VISTHIAHCCALHGCKYGSDRCPVASLDAVQESPCERCEHWMTPKAYRESLSIKIQVAQTDQEDWSDMGPTWTEVRPAVEFYRMLVDQSQRRKLVRFRLQATTVTPWQTFGPS
jgi:hypothetical protein